MTDDRAMHTLMEESADTHADAMRTTNASADDLADLRAEREQRSGGLLPFDSETIAQFNAGRQALTARLGGKSLLGRGLLGGGIGAAVLALLATPAQADTALDTQILQTASSLEILAVATYGAAIELPFIKTGNATVLAFAQMTMKQHDEHRAAFQARTKALSGTVQDKANPKYAPVVEAAKPTLTTPAAVVTLAATLEQVATETYLSDLAMFDDKTAQELMVSVMGVESQHLAVLRAVGALLAGGGASLLPSRPTSPRSRLPPAACRSRNRSRARRWRARRRRVQSSDRGDEGGRSNGRFVDGLQPESSRLLRRQRRSGGRRARVRGVQQ